MLKGVQSNCSMASLSLLPSAVWAIYVCIWNRRSDLTSETVWRPQWPQKIIFFVILRLMEVLLPRTTNQFLKKSSRIHLIILINQWNIKFSISLHISCNCIRPKPCFRRTKTIWWNCNGLHIWKRWFLWFLRSWVDFSTPLHQRMNLWTIMHISGYWTSAPQELPTLVATSNFTEHRFQFRTSLDPLISLPSTYSAKCGPRFWQMKI